MTWIILQNVFSEFCTGLDQDDQLLDKVMHLLLLYSRRFSRYSAPIHWLVHGHMTSNNETISHQMPWAGNIAKIMTSNGKQFTVTHEMLTAVARDRWNLGAVFKFCFYFVLLYNKSLNDWSLGEQSLRVYCLHIFLSCRLCCCCWLWWYVVVFFLFLLVAVAAFADCLFVCFFVCSFFTFC